MPLDPKTDAQIAALAPVQSVNGETGAVIVSATVADGSITNAKLANVATATIKGRTTAGTGVPEDLTATQARTVLGLGTAALSATGDFEAAGAVATHAALTTGVHGKVCAVLASPFTITNASTNTTVLSLSLPVGVHYVSYSVALTHTVGTTWTSRIISGTAVLGGTTGDASGHSYGATNVLQVILTKGSPDVFALRSAGVFTAAALTGHGILITVTTAGTIEFQVSASQAGTVAQAGSVIFAEAL